MRRALITLSILATLALAGCGQKIQKILIPPAPPAAVDLTNIQQEQLGATREMQRIKEYSGFYVPVYHKVRDHKTTIMVKWCDPNPAITEPCAARPLESNDHPFFLLYPAEDANGKPDFTKVADSRVLFKAGNPANYVWCSAPDQGHLTKTLAELTTIGNTFGVPSSIGLETKVFGALEVDCKLVIM